MLVYKPVHDALRCLHTILTSPVIISQPVNEALLFFTLLSWMTCGMNRKKIVNNSMTRLSKNNQRSKTKYDWTPDPNIPVGRIQTVMTYIKHCISLVSDLPTIMILPWVFSHSLMTRLPILRFFWGEKIMLKWNTCSILLSKKMENKWQR